MCKDSMLDCQSIRDVFNTVRTMLHLFWCFCHRPINNHVKKMFPFAKAFVWHFSLYSGCFNNAFTLLFCVLLYIITFILLTLYTATAFQHKPLVLCLHWRACLSTAVPEQSQKSQYIYLISQWWFELWIILILNIYTVCSEYAKCATIVCHAYTVFTKIV